MKAEVRGMDMHPSLRHDLKRPADDRLLGLVPLWRSVNELRKDALALIQDVPGVRWVEKKLPIQRSGSREHTGV